MTYMHILAIISGEYGIRHVNNLREHGPASWTIETWRAPAVIPLIIDYPEDYLPKSFPRCQGPGALFWQYAWKHL